MFLRALQKSPSTFAARHILHNCTIGTWPKELAQFLRTKGGAIRSFWWCDPDHLRESNVYREFTALMEKTPELCKFVDLQRDKELPAYFAFAQVAQSGLSRADGAVVLGYCNSAVEELVEFAKAPPRASSSESSAPKKTLLQLGLQNKDFKVFVRVRPPLAREAGIAPCCEVSDVDDPRGRTVQQILLKKPNIEETSEFVFEGVFRPEASQDDVWNTLHESLDVVGALLDGIGATVFAYGQTGSGKTHTIDGDGTGIVARIVRDLYSRVTASQIVDAQYFQLYNETFIDLIAPPNRLSVDGSGTIVGARSLQAASAEELLSSIQAGSKYRASGSTDMNDSSSRSHAILSISLCGDVGPSGSSRAGARLFVVELAGSERVKRSGVSGARFSEAVAINQSLLALANVVQALVENGGRPRAHIPYRDSALTHALRDSLGGTARTALIACISSASDSAEETLGTLRFASCATHVQNRAEDAKQEAAEQAQEEQLDEAISGRCVEFSSGEAVIATRAGNIHCYGDLSATDGPLVVMIHYYGHADVSGLMWRSMFDPLRAAGCRYLAPDMPGHGGSEGESSGKPEDYATAGGPVDVIIDLLNACGTKRAILMGYDWGGGIACAVAQHHPARCQRLIAWCASVREPKVMEKFKSMGRKAVLILTTTTTSLGVSTDWRQRPSTRKCCGMLDGPIME
eukprot:TRINITY_DN18502_c0_g2_i2.p1 TRINITY_DN18502_c0_g2~~TRINITY_DN18502_c0_g2_i2.p1  ORF type:complete len:805 (+),score=85.67 TRINITY_DN18502_c0_g2_i2:352-2415(+)